ncbi:MAG: hypothetical protein JWO81_3454, partial [Alphaproteobacteria bacterium]|nr:hypothetical protein [Alphaproteobacteria bacterium]
TPARPAEPLRYIASTAILMDANGFEAGVADFVERVLEQLRYSEIERSNLRDIWDALRTELADPALTRFRKIEALLGWDPGEAPDELVRRVEEDGEALGEDAMQELAANGRGERPALSRADIDTLAATRGFSASIRDAVTLQIADSLPADAKAWMRGAHAARALRGSLARENDVVDSPLLSELAGVDPSSAEYSPDTAPISFGLGGRSEGDVVVLRSRNPRGRRFDIARLLGDHLVYGNAELLSPATRSGTYRQKVQRSFAAEFLAPIDRLADYLASDFSQESLEEAAEHFAVSDFTIKLQLVNNHLIDRAELADDLVFQADTISSPQLAA